MPRYADYHRTVVGYHGTKQSTALKIVQGVGDFEPSKNDDDWLGNGIYFWEYAPQQAWLWARRRKRARGWDEEIAVVASMIRLGFCFDLLDPENVKDLGRIYQEYTKALEEAGILPPTNVMSRKRLNCGIFEFAYASFEDRDSPVDTCRAVFVPTTRVDRIWRGSGIHPHAHIQVCVRNPACILGTWLVKPDEDFTNVDERETPEADPGNHADSRFGSSPPEGDS